MQVILIKLITIYQKTLSLFVGHSCRFYPTCSSYAIEAIQAHGSIKGSCLMVKRICRCHPLNPGGVDPVPTVQEQKQKSHNYKFASHKTN